MLSYIAQTLLFQIIFLIMYDLLHRKDTFFVWNRLYLLGSSVLSFILPLITISSIRQNIPPQYIIDLPAVIIGKDSTHQIVSTTFSENTNLFFTKFDISAIGLLVYSIIASILFFLLVKRLIALYTMKSKATIRIESNTKVCCIPNSRDAFSFWNMIFIGDLFSKEERKQILAHELVHLKERHTLDLLWFELLKIVFWFNPLIYLYQSRITLQHEYISDAKAVRVMGKPAYLEQLLNASFQTKNIQFTNNFFNHQIIKKRILMLQKSKSKTSIRLKYLSIFPVITTMIFFSSCLTSQEDQLSELPNASFSKKQPYITENDIPFAKVDKLPSTKSCQWIKDRAKQKKCFSNEIKEYVNAYFDVEAVTKYSNPGTNRIYVRFKIDTKGNAIDVQSRGPAPELEKEAIRVVSSLPQMIPGEHQGEKVNVLYSLPIVFEKEGISSDTSTPDNFEDIPILIEKLDDNTVEKGYYLITGIFKSEKYLEKGMQRLKEKNLNPQVFQNPKDNYYYMYLEKFNRAADAKKNLISDYDGKYQGDLYILKIQ